MSEGQPLVERKPHGAAVILRRVADQIDKMEGDVFGGVAVIVPPQDAGEPIEVLILDPRRNAGQFYATIQTRLQFEMGELEQKQRTSTGFGRR